MKNLSFNLENWNFTNIYTCDYMFYKAPYFNGDVSKWSTITTNCYTFDQMFAETELFEGRGLQYWPNNFLYYATVTGMFCNTKSFNQSYITNWNYTWEELSNCSKTSI